MDWLQHILSCRVDKFDGEMEPRVTVWRFDQGRLDYFQFDEIRRIACALVAIDGIVKPDVENDFLRQSLTSFTSRPFAPANYTVWRNYKRVFGCQLLATEIAGRIVCTELCKLLANDPDNADIDDYMAHFATHFYYPSPIFEGYRVDGPQTFPVIAIIKFLLSEYLLRNKNYISIEEIGQKLIANNVSGVEPLAFYSTLTPKAVSIDLRQPRELVRFISQFSFLKWNSSNLFLEVTNKEEALQIEALLVPHITTRNNYAGAEVLNLGSHLESTSLGDLTISQVNVIDSEFTEGSKIRVRHLRTERSAKLNDFYFQHVDKPHICKMCDMDTLRQYPWTSRLVEIHHLLPLSSPVRVEGSTTSIKDVVGLCPTCHRATHKYYSQWLADHNLRDFRNYNEAYNVYEEVKQRIIL